MKKKRFFAGLMGRQERWLNRMAAQGHRLVHTGKLEYEFADCAPDAYEYRVEYVGHLSMENARAYKEFLEELGYRVFYKNINLNYSVGKVVARPWAEPGGRLATTETGLNRELLIVEKVRDGKPFELHSTQADRVRYLKVLQRPYWYFVLFFGAFGFWTPGMFVPAALMLIPIGLLQREIWRLERDGRE